MKKIKTRVLLVVFMLGTFINYAKNSDLKNVFNPKQVKIVFKAVKTGQQLNIKDSNGTVLHTEYVKKQGTLTKVFDFSKLKDGNYTLELEKDFSIIVKSLKITGSEVIIDENSKKVIFKPVVRSIDNRVMISKIAFDEKPLQVALYFNDEIIYSETIKGDSILNRVYKLDENIKGNYKVVLYNNGRSYTNDFKI